MFDDNDIFGPLFNKKVKSQNTELPRADILELEDKTVFELGVPGLTNSSINIS